MLLGASKWNHGSGVLIFVALLIGCGAGISTLTVFPCSAPETSNKMGFVPAAVLHHNPTSSSLKASFYGP